MSLKGETTKLKILQTAQNLFTTKGYANVTMNDICIACNISRGGLYRHFGSTAEIFTGILKEEQRQAHESLEKAIQNKVSPDKLLKNFIRSRALKVTDTEKCIDNCITDFASQSLKNKQLLIERAETAIAIISRILELGVSSTDFHCENPRDTAIHILTCLEGISKHNTLIPLTSDELELQLQLIEKAYI